AALGARDLLQPQQAAVVAEGRVVGAHADTRQHRAGLRQRRPAPAGPATRADLPPRHDFLLRSPGFPLVPLEKPVFLCLGSLFAGDSEHTFQSTTMVNGSGLSRFSTSR